MHSHILFTVAVIMSGLLAFLTVTPSFARPGCQSSCSKFALDWTEVLTIVIVDTRAPAPFNNTMEFAAKAVAQPSIDLSGSQWIWTGENAGRGGAAPISTRPFRKSLTCPKGKYPTCATILIAA